MNRYIMVLKTLAEQEDPEEPIQGLTSREDIITNYVTGNTYYLDAVNGHDDTGNGSSINPWQTLAKSQASCPAGSLVILRAGNYGSMNDTAYTGNRTNWTVYMCEEGAIPEITYVSFLGQNHYNLRILFYGIKIAPAWVDPGGSAPYNKTYSPLKIYGANYARFYNCELAGTNKYLTIEIAYLSEANYIYFERCNMHKAGEGIVYVNCDDIKFYYNYIHEICACFFKDGWTGNSNIWIEGNHGSEAGFSTSDQYGSDAAFHGSMIALNNATSTVRNNFLHWGGGTNAINFYADGNPTYNDVLIENNVVYNPTATVCIDVEQITTNVVIRNNTFIGQKRDPVTDGEYRYNVGMYVGSFASGYNGSGLSLYNNIILGIAMVVPATTYINMDHNIVYNGSDFDTANSIVATTDKTPSYFESNFFNGALNLRLPAVNQVLDLTLKTGSEAIGFGGADHQPSDSLGGFDANYEFLIPNGTARDASHHDAGAYQS
jgi:hypothetical protein